MAEELQGFANLMKSQAISNVQLHIYKGQEMTFANTFLLQGIKLVAYNIAFHIVCHPYPQTALMECPFSIINKRHIKDKQNTFKLVLTLIQLSKNPEVGSMINQNSISNHISLLTLINACQEIGNVASILNERQLNPYYIFLNPILKAKQYMRRNNIKRKVYTNTQYFHHNEQLNSDHLIHRLNLLENYAKGLQTELTSVLQRKIMKICIIAFMKHLSVNSQKIHRVVLKQEYFAREQERVMQNLMALNEYKEKMIVEKRQALGYYASFSLPQSAQKPEEAPKGEQAYELFRQRVFRHLVKPVSCTVIFIVLMNIF